MNNQKKTVVQVAMEFGRSVIQGVRCNIEAREMEACYNERQNNIAIAAAAMMDANLEDETIARMLQKHWDLRLSEAEAFINWAHGHISPNYRHIGA